MAVCSIIFSLKNKVKGDYVSYKIKYWSAAMIHVPCMTIDYNVVMWVGGQVM